MDNDDWIIWTLFLVPVVLAIVAFIWFFVWYDRHLKGQQRTAQQEPMTGAPVLHADETSPLSPPEIPLQTEKSFPCMIPDMPLTSYEKFAVGATTGGAFRKLYRAAKVVVNNEDLLVKAVTDIAAGERSVLVAKTPIRSIIECRMSPISYASQVQAAFFRSLAVGGGLGLTICILIVVGLAKSGGPIVGDPVVALIGSIGVGLVLGFVFSFLPNYFKIDDNLTQLILAKSDGKALVLALKSDQKECALLLLKGHGLAITDEVDKKQAA